MLRKTLPFDARVLLSMAALLTLLTVLRTPASLALDPCGMVPPIYLAEGAVPLERIGLQKTYVFYKDGLETFVIRPGFRGAVEEFGMLIPFPNPPALRKVPDDTFAHIAAAVDPPEVVVDLSPPRPVAASLRYAVDSEMPSDHSLLLNEVRIVNQEAVGMYEVAVIEAGSADALNKWMTDHGYRYPEGMDDVCNDYVRDKWCFVAIKARVGSKQNVDPKPGMKEAEVALPDGSSFDGHVQGMGFRFRSEELVVPMRLSAFNEGDLHNVVYLLTDEPMKARDLPEGHVVRQISGEELMHNVTQPLPLRIIGGEYEDIPESRLESISRQRDPAPHNGIARELFAGDLMAADSGTLSHEHEELEKELLNIGERLELRGEQIDEMHHEELAELRGALAEATLPKLKSMTMTVIDGDFERDVVARDNIHFTRFTMPAENNTPASYNAREFGPVSTNSRSTAADSAFANAVLTEHPTAGTLILQNSADGAGGKPLWYWAGWIGGAFAVLLLLRILLSGKARSTAVGVVLLASVAGTAQAQEATPTVNALQLDASFAQLHEGQNRDEVIGKIVRMGPKAVPELLDRMQTSESTTARGWAIVCLRQINPPSAVDPLRRLAENPQEPPLPRVWAAAALIQSTTSLEDVAQYKTLLRELPALRRPLHMQTSRLVAAAGDDFHVADLLTIIAADRELQQAFAPVMLTISPDAYTKALLTSNDVNIRQQAASWLATLKSRGNKDVNAAVIRGIRFDRDLTAVPWGNGALFLPGVNWERDEAIALINELTAWFVWGHANEETEISQTLYNNLNSRQLMQAAGYRRASPDLQTWLSTWEQVIGEEAMQDLMQRTGFQFSPARLETIE